MQEQMDNLINALIIGGAKKEELPNILTEIKKGNQIKVYVGDKEINLQLGLINAIDYYCNEIEKEKNIIKENILNIDKKVEAKMKNIFDVLFIIEGK